MQELWRATRVLEEIGVERYKPVPRPVCRNQKEPDLAYDYWRQRLDNTLIEGIYHSIVVVKKRIVSPYSSQLSNRGAMNRQIKCGPRSWRTKTDLLPQQEAG